LREQNAFSPNKKPLPNLSSVSKNLKEKKKKRFVCREEKEKEIYF